MLLKFGWFCLREFLQKLQAGYGKFGIKTVWLDAAEPERPSDDTVGQFLFSKGFIWYSLAILAVCASRRNISYNSCYFNWPPSDPGELNWIKTTPQYKLYHNVSMILTFSFKTFNHITTRDSTHNSCDAQRNGCRDRMCLGPTTCQDFCWGIS